MYITIKCIKLLIKFDLCFILLKLVGHELYWEHETIRHYYTFGGHCLKGIIFPLYTNSQFVGRSTFLLYWSRNGFINLVIQFCVIFFKILQFFAFIFNFLSCMCVNFFFTFGELGGEAVIIINQATDIESRKRKNNLFQV